MGHIKLTDGTLTLVDRDVAADLGRVTWWHWRKGRYSYGVRVVTIKGRKYSFKLHRVVIDAPPGMMVDHINGDGLDNRRANLRLVSMSQNQMNRRTLDGCSSRFKGVSWVPAMGRWRAKVGSKATHLGYFDDQEDAARAYDAAARQLYGEHARTNLALGLYAGKP